MTELHEKKCSFLCKDSNSRGFATNGSHTVWEKCGPKKVTFCTKCDPRFMVGAC